MATNMRSSSWTLLLLTRRRKMHVFTRSSRAQSELDDTKSGVEHVKEDL